MPRFRSKPIVVEAEQWWPDKSLPYVHPAWDDSVFGELLSYELVRQAEARGVDDPEKLDDAGYVETPGGNEELVLPGDWVVTLPDGSRRVFTPEEFELAFEPVEDNIPQDYDSCPCYRGEEECA